MVKPNFMPTNFLNEEIKSHSSVLFNERMHVLLYILETEGVDIHVTPKLKNIMKVKSTLHQIWKNLRTLLFNDPACRSILKLETDTPGLYTPDIGFQQMDQKISFLINNGEYATYDNLQQIVYEIDQVEVILRNILQFYKYFIRFNKPQKPDIDIASQRYREMADERTVNELKAVLGKRAKINFDDDKVEIDDSYFDDLMEDD